MSRENISILTNLFKSFLLSGVEVEELLVRKCLQGLVLRHTLREDSGCGLWGSLLLLWKWILPAQLHLHLPSSHPASWLC